MLAKDYIAERIKKETDIVFGFTGTAIMNMLDSIHKKGIRIINNHHEQASAMAADGYSRVSGKLGVCVVTSGPGATNVVTGTACSWYDSVPVLTIAGQVPTGKLTTCKDEYCNLRQRGFQETDSVSLFKPITKLSQGVLDVEKDIEKAINLCKEDRKGPVFLDLYDDIQRKEIKGKRPLIKNKSPEKKDYKISKIIDAINKSKRPIIVAGGGVNADKETKKRVVKLIEKLGIPVFLTWGAMDLLPFNHPLNCRDFGVSSQRIGNFAVKSADLVLCLGTRMNTSSVLNDLNEISKAKIIMVDIDKYELEKQKTHLAIHSTLYDFAPRLDSKFKQSEKWKSWLNKIQSLRREYPLPKTLPYNFIDALSSYAREDAIIAVDTGNTLCWTYQAWKTKKNQQMFSALNHTPMGYALPASIGAQLASPKSQIISIMGDGGFQVNIQELQTIVGYKMPIKIFVLNNHGYGAIKQNQLDWIKFLKYRVCTEPYMTSIKKLAKGFDKIKYFEIKSEKDFYKIKKVLNYPSAVICEVMIKDGTKVLPKLKFGDEYDDLNPKLKEDERKRIQDILGAVD